jgi:hypothetical protein
MGRTASGKQRWAHARQLRIDVDQMQANMSVVRDQADALDLRHSQIVLWASFEAK